MQRWAQQRTEMVWTNQIGQVIGKKKQKITDVPSSYNKMYNGSIHREHSKESGLEQARIDVESS